MNIGSHNESLNHLLSASSVECKLQIINTLIGKLIQKGVLDKPAYFVLQKILEESKNIIEHAFVENEEAVEEELIANILEDLKFNLNNVIKLLNSLTKILSLICNAADISLEKLESIPKDFNNILYSTFLHCKQSKKLYKSCFNQLPCLAQLFQIAREMHSMLMKCLECQMNKEPSCLRQGILSELLNSLCDTGILLNGLNNLSMVATWRTYSVILGKLEDKLENLEIDNPLKFITAIVCEALTQSLVKNDENKSIKIASFLLKVSNKIVNCSIGHSESIPLIVNFYSSIFRYYKNPENPLNKNINNQTFEIIESKLLAYFQTLQFHGKPNDDFQFFYGFLSVLKYILPRWNYEVASKKAVSSLFHILFYYFNNDDAEILTNSEDCFTILPNIVAAALNGNAEEFYAVEELLLLNLLQGNLSQSTLAHLVWEAILRQAPPTFSFDTLTAITEQCKYSGGVLDIPFINFSILRQFLSTIFKSLTVHLQVNFLEKHPPEDNLNIWSLINLEGLPQQKSFLLDVIINNVIKRFDAEYNWDSHDFLYLVDAFNVLAPLLSSKDSALTVPLSAIVGKFWNFQVNTSAVCSNTQFHYFVIGLTALTIALLQKGAFDKSQSQKISATILNCPKLRPIVNELLEKLNKYTPREQTADPFLNQDQALTSEGAVLSNGSKWNNANNLAVKRVSYEEIKEQEVASKKQRIAECNDADEIISNIMSEVKELQKFAKKDKLSKENTKNIAAILNKLNQLTPSWH